MVGPESMCVRHRASFFATDTSRNGHSPDQGGYISWEERPLATKKSTSTSGKTESKSAAKTKTAAKATKVTAKAKVAAATAVAVEDEVVDEVAEEPKSDCKHAWLIDPPNGPTSDGSCTICGMKREFRNSYEYTPSWTARSGKAGAAKASAAKAAAAKAAEAKKAKAAAAAKEAS